MKLIKSKFTTLISVLVLASCNSGQLLEQPDEETTKSALLSQEQQSIMNYISKKEGITRSPNSYELIPYIVEGDTLMYAVNYENGWELFSNSFNMPMVLMKSNSGTFNPSDFEKVPPFQNLFENMISLLKVEKENSIKEDHEGSEEWNPYRVPQPNPNPNPDPDAVYTLVWTNSYPEVTQKIDHLIKTHWFQTLPFNNHMPFQKYETSSRIAVGCEAVALGQFMYYCHYKWNLSTPIPTSSSYNASNNTYTFSNYSINAWDNMTLTYRGMHQNNSILLGWIAQCIKASPEYDGKKHTGTSAYSDNVLFFFNEKIGYDMSVKNYDMKRLKNMIINGQPVLVSLVNVSTGRGHRVILDDVEYTYHDVEDFYAYVSPSGATNPNPNPNPGPDTGEFKTIQQLRAIYGEVEQKDSRYETCFFKMNLGYGGDYDDKSVNGALFSIVIKDATGNDLNMTFRDYIDYTLN